MSLPSPAARHEGRTPVTHRRMPQWKEHNMATLTSGNSHNWDKNLYSKLEFDWADSKNPGEGTVSVIVGDAAANSYSVPQANIAVDRKSGKLTNNTSKTINYTLS